MAAPSFLNVSALKRRAFRGYIHRRRTLPFPPATLWVEPTNICNLRCPTCPQSLGLKRNKGYMVLPLFERLLSEIAGRVPEISLHFAGESLLHPKFPELVRLARDGGIRTVLHTNATVLTPELSEQIIRGGLSVIVFSFDALTKAQYEAMRVGASYDATLTNIREFLKTRMRLRSRTPFTTIKILQVYSEKSAPPQFPEPVKSAFRGLRVDRFFTEWAHVFGGNFAEETLGKARYAVPPTTRRYPCALLWRGFAVAWDGTAFACCNDLNGDYPLGRFPDQSIAEIWTGKEMPGLREKHLAERAAAIFLCKNCVVPYRPWRSAELWRELAADAAKRLLHG